ncbi:MAG TPA: histidine--tRNA ligase [Tepidisphaeraceae bacterium]|nr:histidine--tRNA ligase [Tepidisphaeraceae bacterium]
MSTKIQAPKGTVDTLPAESWKWQAVERIAREVADLYDFREIRTPIFEHSELFHRGVGETSDIVAKETYTFEDRGGRSITLRPEGTAGVVRAMIEHNTLADQGARTKVFYIGPNFRYENVQKGRVRQHHQFGVEAFGVAEPEQDVECILLQMDFYRRCGVKDLELRVNSLGDRESKERYRDSLVAFLRPSAAQLSEDSKRRLDTNPLRILDSKDPRDQSACQSAPPAIESLSEKSRQHFERVQQSLASCRIPFRVDPTLVRGFDYYTETLWEVVAGGLGAQNALGGGGRYDNLVEQLGGRPTPGVGFGSGLERLLIALESQGVELRDTRRPLVWIVSQGESSKPVTWQLLSDLRQGGVAADMDLSGRGVKGQFKLADREGAKWCVIIGDSEVQHQTAVLKDMKTAEQTTLPRAELIARLRSSDCATAPA